MYTNSTHNSTPSLNGQESFSYSPLSDHMSGTVNTSDYMDAVRENWFTRKSKSIGKSWNHFKQVYLSKLPAVLRPKLSADEKAALSQVPNKAKYQQLFRQIEGQRNTDARKFTDWSLEFDSIAQKKLAAQAADRDFSLAMPGQGDQLRSQILSEQYRHALHHQYYPASREYESILDKSFQNIDKLHQQADDDLKKAIRIKDSETVDNINLTKLVLNNRKEALNRYSWQHEQHNINLGILTGTGGIFPHSTALQSRTEQIEDSFLTRIREFRQEFNRRCSTDTGNGTRLSPFNDLYDALAIHISNYESDMHQLSEYAEEHKELVASEAEKARTGGLIDKDAEIQQLLKELTLPADSPESMEMQIWNKALTGDHSLLTLMRERAQQDKSLYTDWLQAGNEMLNKDKFPPIYTRQSHNHGPLFLEKLITDGDALQHIHQNHGIMHGLIAPAINGLNQRPLQDEIKSYGNEIDELELELTKNDPALKALLDNLQQQMATYSAQDAQIDHFLTSASLEIRKTMEHIATLTDKVEDSFDQIKKQILGYETTEGLSITDYTQYHKSHIAPLEKDLNELVTLTDRVTAAVPESDPIHVHFENATATCQSRQEELTDIKKRLGILSETQGTQYRNKVTEADEFYRNIHRDQLIDQHGNLNEFMGIDRLIKLCNDCNLHLQALNKEDLQTLNEEDGYQQQIHTVTILKPLLNKIQRDIYDDLVARHTATKITTGEAEALPVHARSRSTEEILNLVDETILSSIMEAKRGNHMTEETMNKCMENIHIAITAVQYRISRNGQILRDATDALNKIPQGTQNKTQQREYNQLALIIKEAPKIVAEFREKNTALVNTGISLTKLWVTAREKEFNELVRKINEKTGNPNLNRIKREDIPQLIKSCEQFIKVLKNSQAAKLATATFDDAGVSELCQKAVNRIDALEKLDEKLWRIRSDQAAVIASQNTQLTGAGGQPQPQTPSQQYRFTDTKGQPQAPLQKQTPTKSTAAPARQKEPENVKLDQIIHRGPSYLPPKPSGQSTTGNKPALKTVTWNKREPDQVTFSSHTPRPASTKLSSSPEIKPLDSTQPSQKTAPGPDIQPEGKKQSKAQKSQETQPEQGTKKPAEEQTQAINEDPTSQKQEPVSNLQKIRNFFTNRFSKNKPLETNASPAEEETSVTTQQPTPPVTAIPVSESLQQQSAMPLSAGNTGSISVSGSPSISLTESGKQPTATGIPFPETEMPQLLEDAANGNITAGRTMDILNTIEWKLTSEQITRTLHNITENKQAVKHLASQVIRPSKPSLIGTAAYYFRLILSGLGLVSLANYGPTQLTELYKAARYRIDNRKDRDDIVAKILNNKSTPASFKRKINSDLKQEQQQKML